MRVALSLVFFAILFPTVASAEEVPLCNRALLEMASQRSLSPSSTLELFRTLAWEKINWQKLAEYSDIGAVSRERPSFPKGAELLQLMGVDAGDRVGIETLRQQLAAVAHAFLRPSTLGFLNESSLPEAFVEVPGVELPKGSKHNRLEILNLFIYGKLLALSKTPAVAVSLAFSEVSRDIGAVIESRALRFGDGATRAAKTIWRNKYFLFQPIRSTQIIWNQLSYQFRRRLVNGNFHHPALADPSFTRLAFLMENAALRVKGELPIEQLPLSFQMEVIGSFGDNQVAAQIARGVGPLDVSRAGLELPVISRLAQAASLGRGDARFPGVTTPEKDAAERVRSANEKFRKKFDGDQERLRNLLFKDLEAAHQNLLTAIDYMSKVKPRVIADLKAAHPKYPRVHLIDEFMIDRLLRSEAEQKLRIAARQFAEVYLNSEVLSNVLRFRLPEKFDQIYEGNSIVKLEGARLLKDAEIRARKGDLKERNVSAMDAVNHFAASFSSSPATWLAMGNPSALSAQLVSQMMNAGFLQNKTIGRSTIGLASAFLVFWFVFYPYIAGPTAESKIEKILSDKAVLKDDMKFDAAAWAYLESVREQGVNAADKRLLDHFFQSLKDREIPRAWVKRFKRGEGYQSYNNWSILLESRFPLTMSLVEGGKKETGSYQFRMEMQETLDFLRAVHLAEMERLEKLKRIRDRDLQRGSKKPVPAQKS